MNLEYVRIHIVCRVNQAEYAFRIPMAAPQEYEYVNTYSTRRSAVRPPRRFGQPGRRISFSSRGRWWPRLGGDRYVTCVAPPHVHRASPPCECERWPCWLGWR